MSNPRLFAKKRQKAVATPGETGSDGDFAYSFCCYRKVRFVADPQ
jgi:hypothetical protein